MKHGRRQIGLSIFVVLAVAATTAGGVSVAFNDDATVVSSGARSVGEALPSRSVGEGSLASGIEQAVAAEGVSVAGAAIERAEVASGSESDSGPADSGDGDSDVADSDIADSGVTESAAPQLAAAAPETQATSGAGASNSNPSNNSPSNSNTSNTAGSRSEGEASAPQNVSDLPPAAVAGSPSDSAPPSTVTPTTQAPTTQPPTTQAPTTLPPFDRTAPVADEATRFQEPPATTTSTTTTTTTTSTTTTTAAPAPSGPGCTSGCQTVGFQDLSNRSNVTLENMIISNPGGRCIDLIGASNITLRNVTIENCGTNSAVTSPSYFNGLIRIENANNITIEDSIIRNISNERFGGDRNNAIQITSSSNVTIRNNQIRDVRSNIDDNSNDRGNRAIVIEGSSSHVSINGNHMYNAGRNGVQISRVRGAAGLSITNNIIEGRGRWDSDYEDIINLYSSSGTSSSPIRISGNTIRNGGPSDSGTGIILGDGDQGRGPTQYVVVENNRFIDPGHVGINLAGGDHITVRNNTIIGTGNVPHRTTVGMTINHFGYSSECRDHVVTGNRVYMENQHLPDGVNHLWNPGTCTQNVQISGNNFGDSSLR